MIVFEIEHIKVVGGLLDPPPHEHRIGEVSDPARFDFEGGRRRQSVAAEELSSFKPLPDVVFSGNALRPNSIARPLWYPNEIAAIIDINRFSAQSYLPPLARQHFSSPMTNQTTDLLTAYATKDLT